MGMERKMPTEEEKARFRNMMNEMIKARIEMFATAAPDYARALGTFRAELQKSGFSPEESMQIVLKVADQQGPRGFWGGRHRHRHKDEEPHH